MKKNIRTEKFRRSIVTVFALSLLFTFSLLSGPGTDALANPEVKKTMLTLGDSAPDFQLPDVVSGKTYSLSDFADKKGLLVVVLCRHCPYVQHIKDGLAQFAKDYSDQDLAIVAISANDAEAYPEDSPASLKEMAESADFTFPLLYDESQNTAKALTAKATPDFFLFDQDRTLVYRGQFDGTRPHSGKKVTGEDLRAATDALLTGREIPTDQKHAVGCSIKWKPGNE